MARTVGRLKNNNNEAVTIPEINNSRCYLVLFQVWVISQSHCNLQELLHP